MKKKQKLELQEKGWSEKEIREAQKRLEREELYDRHFSKIVFWSALVVIIFANILISLIMIPFFVVLNNWFLYFVIALLAGTIGFLYNFLIRDISHLERRHHLLAAVLIPLIALANIAAIALFSNQFIEEIHINNAQHNIWIVSVLFAVVFIIPYVLGRIRTYVSNSFLSSKS